MEREGLPCPVCMGMRRPYTPECCKLRRMLRRPGREARRDGGAGAAKVLDLASQDVRNSCRHGSIQARHFLSVLLMPTRSCLVFTPSTNKCMFVFVLSQTFKL
ncbi:hypothetical protein BRADI_1g20635v3 [Brachypodium distachyon]|uniref:Uncharacterized protein n=1 Tax=Brachypodium distachyon TaxID=15368 RepID=A0A2K2DKA6_BRADI|nr:hypothetical protein BRADI_1g20635v3 [Brachypodium distachyon]